MDNIVDTGWRPIFLIKSWISCLDARLFPMPCLLSIGILLEEIVLDCVEISFLFFREVADNDSDGTASVD